MPLFCRHNRYTAECPICSKGTVLDRDARPARRQRTSAPPRSGRAKPHGAAVVKGPYASAGPYVDETGEEYEVRLEKVPGGLRLAEWAAASLRRRAPVLAAADVAKLVSDAADRWGLSPFAGWSRVEPEPDARDAPPLLLGASPGRTGELRDELRVESLPEGRLRIARWIMRPNQGWELQEAPVMLPAARYAEALAEASGAQGRMRP